MRLPHDHAWAQTIAGRGAPSCARCGIPATSGRAAFPCPSAPFSGLPADGTREAVYAAWRQSQEAHR